MFQKNFSGHIIAVVTLAIALAVAGGPLVAFYMSAAFESPPDPADLPATSTSGWDALGWTLLLAVIVGAGAMLLGLPAGFALAGLRGYKRTIAVWFSLFTVVVPPFVFADAWQRMANSLIWVVAPPGSGGTVPAFGSFSTCAFVLILATWPIVALAVAAALSGRPRSIRESSSIGLDRWTGFHGVTMPFVRPFLLGTVFLVFLMAVVNHAVPTLYLVRVLGYIVDDDFKRSYLWRVAARGTLPQVALVALGCAILWFTFRKKGFSVRAAGGSRSEVDSGPGFVLGGGFLLLLGVSVVLPFGFLVYRACSWSVFIRELGDSLEPAGWNLLFGLLAATLVIVLGFLGGYFAEVERRRGWNAVTILALFAFAVPGIVPGLGLMAIAGAIGAWIRGPLAFIGCGIPFFIIALLIGRAAFRTADLRQLEAAALSGLSRWRTFRHVILPMSIRPLVMAWLIIFALALGEVTVVGLFIPPGMNTLSRSLFMSMHYGSPAVISIRCLFLAFLTAVPVIIAVIVWRVDFFRGRKARFPG